MVCWREINSSTVARAKVKWTRPWCTAMAEAWDADGGQITSGFAKKFRSERGTWQQYWEGRDGCKKHLENKINGLGRWKVRKREESCFWLWLDIYKDKEYRRVNRHEVVGENNFNLWHFESLEKVTVPDTQWVLNRYQFYELNETIELKMVSTWTLDSGV